MENMIYILIRTTNKSLKYDIRFNLLFLHDLFWSFFFIYKLIICIILEQCYQKHNVNQKCKPNI